MAIDAELLKILACPACRTAVVETGDQLICTNKDCRRRYAVTDGIPVMLVDESTQLDPTAWGEIMRKCTPSAS
jgi:uncharacterized protein